MKLDLTSMEKALASLHRAILRSVDAPEDDELRDAVIQRFEYCYEMSFKMLKRQIELESPSPAEVDHLAFNDLIREASERGFPAEVEEWLGYRRARNLTSHTYDEAKAKAVHAVALQFLPNAQALLHALRQRPGD